MNSEQRRQTTQAQVQDRLQKEILKVIDSRSIDLSMRKTHNPFCPTTGQSSKESDYVNKATNLWLIIEKVNDID